MKFIGIDLAWKVSDTPKYRTGLAVLDGNGCLIDVGLAASNSEIISFVRAHADGSCALGIDAPLVVPNETGQRPVEQLLARRRIPAYPANRSWLTRAFGGIRGEILVDALRREGFSLATGYPKIHEPEHRHVFEVFPSTAYRSFLGLSASVKLKRGKGVRVADIRAGVGILRDALVQGAGDTALVIDDSRLSRPIVAQDIDKLRGTGLDQFGDMLDAIIAACIIYRYYSNSSSTEVIGDITSGCILLPHATTKR